MLEFYQAYATYEDLMDLTEVFFRGLCDHLGIKEAVSYQEHQLDFLKPFVRMSMQEAVAKFHPSLDEASFKDAAKLAAYAESLGIAVQKEWGLGTLLLEIFEHDVESQLIQPTFITQYPKEVSPLARANDQNREITDRFELFIAGKEIANGFSELNDPDDQKQRFLAQVAAKDAGDDEAMHFDADYIRALEYGLPPTAGEGIGIDRLVMLFTNSPSIRDVLLFPHMRPIAIDQENE